MSKNVTITDFDTQFLNSDLASRTEDEMLIFLIYMHYIPLRNAKFDNSPKML